MTRHSRTAAAAGLLLLALACTGGERQAASDSTAAQRLQKCSDAPNAVVSSAGLGPVRIGMRVRDVAQSCALGDTTARVAYADSGTPIAVHFGRHSALLIAGADSVIRGIVIADSAFRTDRGIGVGSRVRTLRFAYGRICAVERNGDAVLAVAGLDGIVFTFDPSRLPNNVYRKQILGSELRTNAADDLPIRGMEIGKFESPCPEQRLAVARPTG